MNNKRLRLALHAGLTVVVMLLLSSGGALAGGGAEPLPVGNGEAPASLPKQVGVQSQSVLWDQISAPVPADVSDTATNYPGQISDYQIADDFVISGTHTIWQISSLKVVGIYSGNVLTTTNSVNVSLYNDVVTSTVHLPGTSVYSALLSAPIISNTITNTSVITLPAPLTLSAGRYWLAVQVNLPDPGTLAWEWTEYNSPSPYDDLVTGTGPTNASALMRFTTSCVGVWGRRITDCGVGTNPDMKFQLIGQQVIFTSFVDLPLVRK